MRLQANRLPEEPAGEGRSAVDRILDSLGSAIEPLVDPDLTHPRKHVAPNDRERMLMADVLLLAIVDSRKTNGGRGKARLGLSKIEAARNWLRAEPGFTARECCEAIGIDYDAMMARLEREWASHGGRKAVKP